jgi:hypothetical protein
LDRAFDGLLKRYLDPLIETVLASLDAIYPYYHQSLCSPVSSPQLNKHIVAMFGILQIVLNTPTIQKHIANSSSSTPRLDQILFLQTLKFAQLSDEIVNLWLDDNSTVTDEYEESTGRVSVRAAVSTCLSEVYSLIYLTRILLSTLRIIGYGILRRLGESMDIVSVG